MDDATEGVTTSDSGAEVDPPKLASPEYTAVMVYVPAVPNDVVQLAKPLVTVSPEQPATGTPPLPMVMAPVDPMV